MVQGLNGVPSGAQYMRSLAPDFSLDKARELHSKNLNTLIASNSTELEDRTKHFKDSLSGFKAFG